MNDKELLKYAAIACQWAFEDDDDDGLSWVVWGDDNVPMFRWNPLTDDGDAFRLAVKCEMKIYPGEAYPWDKECANYSTKFGAAVDEDEEPDPYVATRRAIVRAAAEIGRAVK
jgi:hypothetical protein